MVKYCIDRFLLIDQLLVQNIQAILQVRHTCVDNFNARRRDNGAGSIDGGDGIDDVDGTVSFRSSVGRDSVGSADTAFGVVGRERVRRAFGRGVVGSAKSVDGTFVSFGAIYALSSAGVETVKDVGSCLGASGTDGSFGVGERDIAALYWHGVFLG
jgi:hypothetical protein